MKTVVELDKEGVRARMFHRSGRKAWTHVYGDDEECEACIAAKSIRDTKASIRRESIVNPVGVSLKPLRDGGQNEGKADEAGEPVGSQGGEDRV